MKNKIKSSIAIYKTFIISNNSGSERGIFFRCPLCINSDGIIALRNPIYTKRNYIKIEALDFKDSNIQRIVSYGYNNDTNSFKEITTVFFKNKKVKYRRTSPYFTNVNVIERFVSLRGLWEVV